MKMFFLIYMHFVEYLINYFIVHSPLYVSNIPYLLQKSTIWRKADPLIYFSDKKCILGYNTRQIDGYFFNSDNNRVFWRNHNDFCHFVEYYIVLSNCFIISNNL